MNSCAIIALRGFVLGQPFLEAKRLNYCGARQKKKTENSIGIPSSPATEGRADTSFVMDPSWRQVNKTIEPTRRQFMKDSLLAGTGLLVGPLTAPEGVDADAFPQTDKDSDRALVENDFIRIELNPQTGDINGLHHKRSGKDYIVDKKAARAFRLNVPFTDRITGFNADSSANALDSWMQTQCTIAKQTDAKGQTLVVRYLSLMSEVGSFEIELSYRIRLPHDSEDALLQVEITNRSRYRIREVFFPWISGIGVIESEQADRFVAPNMIRSLKDIRQYRLDGNWEEHPYVFDMPRWPDGYGLTMPWMNHGGTNEGLYLASLSREGVYHKLMIQDFGDGTHPILAFAWAIPCYLAPGKSWRSPEMVLGLHNGDWHVAADKYRATLEGWYQKPETPQEFKKAFASYNSFFAGRNFDEIVYLAEDIRKYGLRHLVMWNFGDYYPNVMDEDDLSIDPPRLGLFTRQWGGLPRLKAANRNANALGVDTGIIFSQRLWNKDALTPELREMAAKWVIRSAAGDPLTESWDHQHLGACQWSNAEPFFGHLDYIMCSGVKDWQDFAVRNISGVLGQGGYSMMFYDQAVESNLCFSSEHAHSDVSAPCIATHEFLRSLKESMRKGNPNAVLIGEGCEVVASQVLDAGWVWRTPSNPEVFRYTLPWTILACAVDVDPGLANKYFVLGLHLAIVGRGIENGKKLSDFPDFAQHIARLASFRERGERFLVSGTFKDDIGLRATGAFAKVYETASEVAIIAANLTDELTTATFDLDSDNYEIHAPSFFTISSRRADSGGTAKRAGSALTANCGLGPFEVMAIVFSRKPEVPKAGKPGCM